MTACPHCGSEMPTGARFCPACGNVVSSVSQLPTALGSPPTSPRRPGSPSAPIGRLESSVSRSGDGFTPGQILGGRYRVIGLLGRGGMGEVYRADDLKLGQPVALKFLPRRWSANADLLELFHQEVRNARQVSHPNVCRVYDIGEADGLHFISMEYVDGEDLATLLRRIGRFTASKGHDVARQLCAGLSAAHDKGVLHRDLKPSNVMIDGNGRVRITDFGLAVRADEPGAVEYAGTPAYMAPEQFGGGPVTLRSDLYALGLVLYEMYTGKRPFDATRADEWRSRHTQTSPPLPSQVERDVEDSVERAILRCLEKDPSRRPVSALQVAAALPGGDPLAAALAAGETPSPEIVAAAGGEGAISLRRALALALGLVITVVTVCAISPYSTDLGLSAPRKNAAVLRDRAREILAGFGYRQSQDSEAWFGRGYAAMLYLADHEPSTRWRRRMHAWAAPVIFTYRQSPWWLETTVGAVGYDHPPLERSDMANVVLDAEGALRILRVVPPQRDTLGPAGDSLRAAPAPDWRALFAAAALPYDAFEPVTPEWVPPMAYDARAEWVGKAPWDPDIPLRVGAAAYRGRPVHFEVLGPWSKPLRMQPTPPTVTQRIASASIVVLIGVVTMVALSVARRNLRLGRGDRRGAMRLGLVVLMSHVAAWLLGGHHVFDLLGEFRMASNVAAGSLWSAVITGLIYLAVEPYVRRIMPELLIGWARLLEGRLRDPRVGRDILIGALAGSLVAFVFHATNALPTWIPLKGQTTLFPDGGLLWGGGRMWATLLERMSDSLSGALYMFGALFLLRVLLRDARLATAGLVLGGTLLLLGGENALIETPGAFVSSLIMGLTIARFGLLAGVSTLVFYNVLGFVPLPLAPAYAGSTLVMMGLLVVITLYALRTSIGSRPLMVGALEPA